MAVRKATDGVKENRELIYMHKSKCLACVVYMFQ